MLALGLSGSAQEPRFITFDAPGAGADGPYGQGTFAIGLNPWGAIVGSYLDASNVYDGFLRAPNGVFTTIDVTGALATRALNINVAGVIARWYRDASNVHYGFVRTPSGAITTFDAPGAGTGGYQGTMTANFSSLNDAGAITGNYTDSGGVNHGYVRAPNGTFTTFDAGTGSAGYLPPQQRSRGGNHGMVY
jgi:hypothetical protein